MNAVLKDDGSESEEIDVFELMSGMGLDNEDESNSKESKELEAEENADNDSLHDWNDASQPAADHTDDEEVSAESCFTFWKGFGSTPTLVDSLSRKLQQLRSLGFALPWHCATCNLVNVSWFGACEDCKCCNEAYRTAVRELLADDAASLGELHEQDHVLLVLACRHGGHELEACFLMCEAIASSPDKAMPLYRRAFRLWSALDSHLDPDGVPQCLREDADEILASRSANQKNLNEIWGIFPPGWQSPLDIAISRQHAQHVETSREGAIDRISDTVVVYSYHQDDGNTPGSWWEQALRSGASLKKIHEDHLRVALHVICNIDVKTYDEYNVFDEHILCDLANASLLPNKGRALCGTKIQAIIHCLERGYRNVIYMDSDTHILRPFLTPMLAALQFYDLTGVFEGPPVGMAQTGLDPLLENPQNQAFGFELNTGVLGVRASALGLCQAWLNEYREHVQKYAAVSSADQPALMQVLRHRSERVFPLPPTINFRPYTVFSPSGPNVPAVIHDHHHDVAHAHEEIIDAVSNHMRYGLRWK